MAHIKISNKWPSLHSISNFHNGKKRGFPGGSVVKNMLAKQETEVQSPGVKDILEKEMATHSSILAWEIPWTEEPGRLLSPWGGKRVGHDLANKQEEEKERALHNGQKRKRSPFHFFFLSFYTLYSKKKGGGGACRQQQQQNQAYKNKISAKEKPRRTKVEPGY